jgi:hypothetical protein
MRPGEESARTRGLLGWAAWALVLVALAALGWRWHQERGQVWEPPGLGPPLVLLRGPPADSSRGTRLVAVNPDCRSCRQSLARTVARAAGADRVGALIVDTPSRPGSAVLAGLRGSSVWWDAEGVWRRRWGHRIYGEVLCFDSKGRYVRTLPPR